MFLDGTFGIVDGYILHTLSVQVKGKSVPVVFAFLSEKTIEMYSHFLQKLKEKMGNDWKVPGIWHVDFEKAYKSGIFFIIFDDSSSNTFRVWRRNRSLSLLVPLEEKFSKTLDRYSLLIYLTKLEDGVATEDRACLKQQFNKLDLVSEHEWETKVSDFLEHPVVKKYSTFSKYLEKMYLHEYVEFCFSFSLHFLLFH